MYRLMSSCNLKSSAAGRKCHDCVTLRYLSLFWTFISIPGVKANWWIKLMYKYRHYYIYHISKKKKKK